MTRKPAPNLRALPNIRSMPGQVYQLSDIDLQELKLRQQAVMVTKATYLLSEAGYNQYLSAMMAKYGHAQDDLPELGINMTTGEIVRNGPKVRPEHVEAPTPEMPS